MHFLVYIQVRRTNISTVFYSQKSFFFYSPKIQWKFCSELKLSLDGCSLQDNEDITCLVFLAVFSNIFEMLHAFFWLISLLSFDTLSRLVLLFKFNGVFFCPFPPLKV